MVEKLQYTDATTKVHYRYVYTSGEMEVTTPGRAWYRLTVAREIKNAINHLPSAMLSEVSVRPIIHSSNRVELPVNTFSDIYEAVFDSTGSGTLASNVRHSLGVGDYFRVDSEYRRIKGIVSASKRFEITRCHLEIGDATDAFKFTGMEYEVEFAPAYRKHEDCSYNGVNLAQSDIDIGAATSGLEGFRISAMCHPGGFHNILALHVHPTDVVSSAFGLGPGLRLETCPT